jgi:DNA anti-recombination protein RmuC
MLAPVLIGPGVPEAKQLSGQTEQGADAVNTDFRTRRWSLVGALVATACLAASTASFAQEGVKETEQFIKAGSNTAEAVGEAKTQLQTTLTNYNDLLGKEAKDMKDSYNKLKKNVKEFDDKAADARTRVTEMQTTGTAYFAGRAAAIKKIQDPTLQSQAQTRLDASQKDFAGVMASLNAAREALTPLRKELADHIKYLESDLSPSGTASLKPQAATANANAATVFAKGDDAIRTANAYFNGLRAR